VLWLCCVGSSRFVLLLSHNPQLRPACHSPCLGATFLAAILPITQTSPTSPLSLSHFNDILGWLVTLIAILVDVFERNFLTSPHDPSRPTHHDCLPAISIRGTDRTQNKTESTQAPTCDTKPAILVFLFESHSPLFALVVSSFTWITTEASLSARHGRKRSSCDSVPSAIDGRRPCLRGCDRQQRPCCR
jgi:hypothetical protein